MAGKAAQDAAGGIERAKRDAAIGLVTGRAREAIQRAIPGFAQLAIGETVLALEEGDGLQSSAEGPVAGLRRGGRSEGVSMSALGLPREFGFMARAARLRADVCGGIKSS